MLTIQQIQDKLLAYYAQPISGQDKVYEVLGFAEWSDYHNIYEEIWTPQFKSRIYILQNPYSTLEQAFVHGVQVGWLDGFDSGYNNALEDMNNGIIV